MKNATRALIFTLIASVTSVCMMPATGWAMLAPTQSRTEGRSADMKTIQTALESKIVRERLKTLGLTDKEIESRLGKLTDQQVHQLAKNVDSIAPGGFIGELLVGIVLVLLIIFLIKRI